MNCPPDYVVLICNNEMFIVRMEFHRQWMSTYGEISDRVVPSTIICGNQVRATQKTEGVHLPAFAACVELSLVTCSLRACLQTW